MKFVRDLEQRMTDDEYLDWQEGGIEDRATIAIKYLLIGENVELDSLGENMAPNGQLDKNFKYIEGILPEGFKASLHPPEQRTHQYKRLILTRVLK